MYIRSFEQLKELIGRIRTDLDVVVDIYAGTGLFQYDLPHWITEEFKASEILLYEHHFSLIDADKGGSIDVDELQQLIISFGGKISLAEAQAMLDEYDMDGGGTIDFFEFMVLIYKIQRGTIDLTTSDLAQILTEAKSQLNIFEEIVEVSKNPPQYCSVYHFGGSPVTCDFLIQGPQKSPYEGFEIKLQMIFYDGYPYRQPEIQFQGRVLGLHMLPQISGHVRFMHMKHIWDATWTMHRMLSHTVDLLIHPDPALLPDNLYEIYSMWKEGLYIKCKEYEDQLIYIQEEQAQIISDIMKDITLTELYRNIVNQSCKETDPNYTTTTAILEDNSNYSIDYSSQSKVVNSNHKVSKDMKHISQLENKIDLKGIKLDDSKYSNNTSATNNNSDMKTSISMNKVSYKDTYDEKDINPPEYHLEEVILYPTELLKKKIKIYSQTLTIEELTMNDKIKIKIKKLSRIEQMHLQTMFKFLISYDEKYFELVYSFMNHENLKKLKYDKES